GAVVATIALVALVLWELFYTDEPVIDFRLFRNAPLTVGCGLGAVVGFALFGSSFLLPQFTQSLLNYPALQAGLVLMPRAVAMLIAMPIVGRLYNLISPRSLVTVGVLLLAYAYWRLGHLTRYVGFWSFLPILMMSGIGMSTGMVTLSTVSLSSIPRYAMTAASSLFTLTRRESGNVAYAALATLVARRTQVHRSELVDTVTATNPVFQSVERGFRSMLMGHGLSTSAGQRRDLAMVNAEINRQSTMMAYNDCFWLLVPMFLLALPLIFLLPKEGVP